MYLKVQIPARFLIIQSETVSDSIELGVIGTKATQFTLMELNSTNAPWVQYSKSKDHIFKPADFTNTMPLFRHSDSAGNVSNKIRPNKFPRNFNMIKLNFKPLNPEQMSSHNQFNEANLPASDLPSNFKDSALNLELFRQQNGNDLLDNYLNVRLKGAEAFMDWVSGQDDMFGFQNSGVLRKNDSNLNASRGGLVWSNAHLWHDDYVNSEKIMQPSIMRPVEFNDYAFSDKDKSGYGLLSFNENALDVKFQQRMIADAPYNLSTVKFNTTQTHPVGLLYRYQSAINDDAEKLRVASSGYRRYTEFKPPLLDWEGLGYPRLSQTKSSSELRRKPIQITFTKNRGWIMKPSLAEATEEQFASDIFSIKKLFHSNDKEFSTFDKTLLESTSRLRSTKCYGLTDFKRKYYYNPETPVVIDENENSIWLETSKLEPKENLEIHTYGYAQYGYGLQYKMERTAGLHISIDTEIDYGGKTRYYDNYNKKKVNAEPYWVRDNYRSDRPQDDFIGVNPSNGEYNRMRFMNDSGNLHYIRNSPQILTTMSIETEMKEHKARNLNISYEFAVGGEIPTSTSPHWSAWKTSVANVKGVKFKSENFFKIFDYQTCFHNNLNNGNEHRHISQEIEGLNYAIYGMHELNPNKFIKKWWKTQVKDGKIDATKDIPLYNIKVEDVRFSEGKKKMNGFKITYTIPYFNFAAFVDEGSDMGESVDSVGLLLYPNYLNDLQTITGTTDRHGVLISEITIALHPDKLGVSTFVKSDSLHSIEIQSNKVQLVQRHINADRIAEDMRNLVDALKLALPQKALNVGAIPFTRMANQFSRKITDRTLRAYIDETGITAGSDRDKFTSQPLQTSMPSDFVKLDDCFMMYNYALQKGLLGRQFVSTQHIRSGFTVSDPLSLPLTFKKGKVTPVGNFKYTYPLPYRRLNSYLTSTGEIFRPDNNLSTYNYISLQRYELPTGLAPLDLTKAIPAPNNDLDVTHGGVISLFTSTNYDTKKELKEVVWINSGHQLDGLRIVDDSEKKSLLETLKNLKKNKFTDSADKSLTSDYAKVVKNTLASKDLTKKEGTFIHFTTRKSDTDGKYQGLKDKPNFEFRVQKVGGRLMKYAKDTQGYSRGKMPKDYTIFADLILPFAPRVLRVDEVGSDIDSSEKFWAMTIGKNYLQGVYNYQPQRRGSNYISDDVANYFQGVPSEWCPETYTYFGRTLGLFNWWGSLL